MSEIKIKDCDYESDYLSVDITNTNKIYLICFERRVDEEVAVGIDLEGVNKLQKFIDDWKEINGYD